jgi:hypothetical protein
VGKMKKKKSVFSFLRTRLDSKRSSLHDSS